MTDVRTFPQVDLEQLGAIGEQVAAQLNAADFSGCLRNLSGNGVEVAERLLPLASSFSVAPISQFYVGAVAIGSSGKHYLGANMEFLGMPLNASLHAEQSAVLNARMHGEEQIVSLVVSAAPCGHCRQFLSELPCAGSLKLSFTGATYDLASLLPHSFGEERPEDNHVLSSVSYRLESSAAVMSGLAEQAVVAASRSYTPYTNTPEGVAVACANGSVFTGQTVESIAFNPSVPAIVAALNQRNFSSSRKDEVKAVAHAKLEKSLSEQFDFTKSLVSHMGNVPVEAVSLKLGSPLAG